jgi:hypothetical protein
MEDAQLRISEFPGQYNLNPVQSEFDRAPQTSAGLNNDRLQDEPPSSLVDIESQLRNQYDIIGKSGYVHTRSEYGSELLNRARAQPRLEQPMQPQPAPDVFLTPIDDRFIRKTCDTTQSFYPRLDVNPPPTRFPVGVGPRGGANTRLEAKDAFEPCERRFETLGNALPPPDTSSQLATIDSEQRSSLM